MENSSYFRFDDDNKTNYIFIYNALRLFRSYIHIPTFAPIFLRELQQQEGMRSHDNEQRKPIDNEQNEYIIGQLM